MKNTKNMRLLLSERIFTNFRFQYPLSSQDINTSNFLKEEKSDITWGGAAGGFQF